MKKVGSVLSRKSYNTSSKKRASCSASVLGAKAYNKRTNDKQLWQEADKRNVRY